MGAVLLPDRVRREFLSAEQLMGCCDVVWSADRRKGLPVWSGLIPPGSLVYAKRDHLNVLAPVLAKSRSRVVLVTAESDDAVQGGDFRRNPPQVAAWFSTNACDPEVAAIPLGLGNSYCMVTAKAEDLARVCEMRIPREKWLSVNFRPETNPAARGPLIERYSSAGWATVRAGGLAQQSCLEEIAAHRFVLCPPGNGIDTHRMWEALYLGTIPVVQRHPALDSFSDLPILFVDDLGGLNPGLLEREYERINAAKWNTEKLFLPWWRDRLESAKSSLRSSGERLPLREFLAARARRFLTAARGVSW